jgi:serine/threonine-protein kinase
MFSEACTPFVNAIRQARLLSDAQWAEVSRGGNAGYAEPRELALELVRRDWLTPFQVERLARGKGGELVLGKYVLLERLGEGGMGQVFKARHRVMDRLVALKIIHPELLHHALAVRRFHQEIRAVAQLSHPNIVTAHDADQEGETHFLVMEYVEGIDLKQLVQASGRLGVGQACEYIRQAALGLQHAHERGLVHRDLKPGNLLITVGSGQWAVGSKEKAVLLPIAHNPQPSVVKILDLGLALLRSTDPAKSVSSAATQPGALIGTPDYMAPEQAINPRSVDIRADLYSLGCTLYFLLTARAPFEEGSLLEKLYKHKFESPPPLESLRPEVPADVAAIVHKLIAKEPEDRYGTPAELAEALTPFCQAGDAVAIPKKKGTDPQTRRRSGSTVGSGDGQPDTMSAPDVVEGEANSTNAGWVSLERALAALTPSAPAETETRRLPGLSSVSDFIAVDGGLDELSPPAKVPAKQRGLIVAAVLLVVLLLAAIGLAAVKFGPWNGDKKQVVAGTNEGDAKTDEPIRKVEPPIRDPKQIDPGKQDGDKPQKPAVTEPGFAKPLGATAREEVASSRMDVDLGDDRNRGIDKPATGADAIVCPVTLKRPLEVAAFTPDVQNALVNTDDIVWVYDLADFRAGQKPLTTFVYPFQVLLGEKPPVRAALAARGGRVLLATVDRAVVKGQVRPSAPVLGFVEQDSPQQPHVFPTGGPAITCVCGSPSDPRLLLSGDQQGTVCLWEMEGSPRNRASWSRHRHVIECLAVSLDGNVAISGDRGGKLWLWDVTKREPLRELIGHQGAINAVALSANGGVAASAGDDSTVRLWETATGKELLPQPLAGSVQCLAFSRDGKRLATGGKDKMVRLLDLATGSAFRSWSGHEAAVLAVAITSDGDAVFSVAKDNTIRRWGVYPSAGMAQP